MLAKDGTEREQMKTGKKKEEVSNIEPCGTPSIWCTEENRVIKASAESLIFQGGPEALQCSVPEAHPPF